MSLATVALLADLGPLLAAILLFLALAFVPVVIIGLLFAAFNAAAKRVRRQEDNDSRGPSDEDPRDYPDL